MTIYSLTYLVGFILFGSFGLLNLTTLVEHKHLARLTRRRLLRLRPRRRRTPSPRRFVPYTLLDF